MAKSKLIVSRSKKSTVLVSTRTLQDAIQRANALVESLMETNPNDANINKVEAAVQHMSRILNANPQQMKQDGASSIEDYMDNAKMPAEAMKLKNEVDMISKLQSRGGMQQQVNYVPDSAVSEQGIAASQKQADGGAAFTTDRDEKAEAKSPELLAVPRLAKKKKEAVPEPAAAAPMPEAAPVPAASGKVNPIDFIPTETLIKVIEDLPKEEDFAQNKGKQDALIELTNVLKVRPVLPPEQPKVPQAPEQSSAPGLAQPAAAPVASAKKRADLGDHAMSPSGETINNGSGASSSIGNGGTTSHPQQVSTDSGISKSPAPEKADFDLGGLSIASALEEKIAMPPRPGREVKNKHGWTGRLRNTYDNDFEQFQGYDEIYNIAERLGFGSAEEAWEANPKVYGSVYPEDLHVVSASDKTAEDYRVQDYKVTQEGIRPSGGMPNMDEQEEGHHSVQFPEQENTPMMQAQASLIKQGVTPPGISEKLMHKLKDEYPGDKEKAYATAWSIHNNKESAMKVIATEIEKIAAGSQGGWSTSYKPLEVDEDGGRTPEIAEAHAGLEDHTGIDHPATTMPIKLNEQQGLKTGTKVAGDMSTSKALKQSESLGNELKKMYLDAKSLTTVNDTRPVREAVEAIFRAADLFDGATKTLNKQDQQEKSEEEAAKIKVENKKKSSYAGGLALAAAE